MKRSIILLFFTLTFGTAQAQLLKPVSWSYLAKRTSALTAEIHLKATLDKGYHIYATDIAPGGPNPTIINFTKSADYTMLSKPVAPKPLT